jgi:multidrug resistance efflux pump
MMTVAVVILAIVLGWFAWEYYTRAPWTRDARVRADVVTLSADVSGRIVKLAVQDNQHVDKGQLLLEIDPAFGGSVQGVAGAIASGNRRQ